MNHFEFDDVELTYEIRGHGDPVVLVHASAFVRWYEPLIEHLPAVSVLHYRRRLRADAGGDFRALTAADDAAICARLMAHVGWPTAHIVGHSYGGLVALSLAMDEPQRVRSLVLLEPAIVRGTPTLNKSRPVYSVSVTPILGGTNQGRWTPSWELSAATATAPRWTGPFPAHSMTPSWKPTCFFKSRCPQPRDAASTRAADIASRSRSSRSTEPIVLRVRRAK